jgi:acyl dehydratase
MSDGDLRYFEDLVVGTRASFGRYEVTREEVTDFARKYDPQPFHLSDEAAAQTHFGRLSASGWHTAAMTMAMLVANFSKDRQASLGSPGIDCARSIRATYYASKRSCSKSACRQAGPKWGSPRAARWCSIRTMCPS